MLEATWLRIPLLLREALRLLGEALRRREASRYRVADRPLPGTRGAPLRLLTGAVVAAELPLIPLRTGLIPPLLTPRLLRHRVRVAVGGIKRGLRNRWARGLLNFVGGGDEGIADPDGDGP